LGCKLGANPKEDSKHKSNPEVETRKNILEDKGQGNRVGRNTGSAPKHAICVLRGQGKTLAPGTTKKQPKRETRGEGGENISYSRQRKKEQAVAKQ